MHNINKLFLIILNKLFFQIYFIVYFKILYSKLDLNKYWYFEARYALFYSKMHIIMIVTSLFQLYDVRTDRLAK